jgi:hypothetical protein
LDFLPPDLVFVVVGFAFVAVDLDFAAVDLGIIPGERLTPRRAA